jgi:hypothetical protein
MTRTRTIQAAEGSAARMTSWWRSQASTALMEALLCVSAHRATAYRACPCVNPHAVGLDIGSEEIGVRNREWCGQAGAVVWHLYPRPLCLGRLASRLSGWRPCAQRRRTEV